MILYMQDLFKAVYLLTSLGEHELSNGTVVVHEHFVQDSEQTLVTAGPLLALLCAHEGKKREPGLVRNHLPTTTIPITLLCLYL